MTLLVTIPGVARRSAQVILAEIGADMSRFPTAGHLASWAGMPPGNHESAGRSKDTYLAAQYAQIRSRHGPQRAAVAVGHSILVIAWHLPSTSEVYNDLAGDYFDKRRNRHAHQRRLVAQLEAMGHKVTLEPAAA